MSEEAGVSQVKMLGWLFSLFQSFDVILHVSDSQNVFWDKRSFDFLVKNLVPLHGAEPGMLDDLANVLESLGWVFCQKAVKQVTKICISKVLQVWIFIQNSLHGFHLVGRVRERRQAYHHLIQKTAEGPKVTLLVKLLSFEKLRR